MRLVAVLISGATLFSASLLPAYAAAPPDPVDPPAKAAPAPAQIRLEMRLSRVDKGSAAGTSAASPTPVSPAIATPALTTLDRGTATVSVTNKDLSYSVSVSPSIEQGEKAGASLQLLWNLRLSGRALPEGTNSVTTSGAARIAVNAVGETLLTELPISDAKTGNVSVFRLTVRVAVTRTPSSDPSAVPVPPAPSSTP